MKKTMKKIVSVVLALAMVITSISYTPSMANAADGWTMLSNFSLQNGGATDLAYRIVQGEESRGINVYGSHYVEVFPNKTEKATAYYLDEGLTTEGSTVYNGWMNPIAGNDIQLGLGLNTEHPTDAFNKDKYYSLRIVYPDGDVVYQFKVGNPTETPTVPTETTTPAPTEEPQLEWKTDANLTAALGEGTRYAVVGELPDGNYTINADNINITTGAFGSKLVITLNDTELWNGAYAAGVPISYTTMKAGMNTIKADGVHNTAGNVSMTIYVDVPAKPLNLYVNNYVSATGKYIVKFDNVENAVSYKVYIDDVATDISLGGSGDYIDYSELASVSEGDHNLAVSAVYADGTETSKSGTVSFNKPASAGENTEIPQIYVQTDDTAIQPLSIQKSQGNLNSSITVVDNKGGQFADIFEDGVKTTIKVRGNSTADAQKKAFNIKFTDKQNVFNFGSAKKWSLLANAFDKSLIRNKLAMDLGIDAGVPYNSNSRYIDLYLNGRYMGNYLLIESVEVGTSRVDIGSEATDAYNNDILVELENNGKDEEGVTYFTTTTYGQRFVLGSPETVGDSTQEFFDQKLANVQTVFNQFETDLQANDYAAYSQYIDVDSFVNFYLIAELFKCQDIAFSSTRFFIKDNKIYAGPLWDYDLSSGNVSTSYYGATNQSAQNYLAKNMEWFGALMNNDTFKEKVVARYYELLPRIKAIYEGENSEINKIVAEIENSATRNYTSVEQGGAGWSATVKDSADGYSYANDNVYTSFNNDGDTTSSVALFKAWMADRVEFLSSEWHDAGSVTTEDMIGSTLYNLALNKDLTVYKRINQGALANINNGNVTLNNGISADFGAISPGEATGDGWGSQNDPVYMTVDLGDYYDASTLDKIVIQYKDNNANDTVIGRSYIIQYSMDGINFRDVKAERSVTELDASNRTTDGISDVTGAVRYVRVYYPKSSTYGIQVAEFAVLDTNKNATTVEQEIISAPTGVTAVQPEESEHTIKVNIPVVEGQEDYKYIIKVDGEVKATNVSAGDTTITGVTIGEHKVTVVAIHNGFTSESSEEISVQVTGAKSLEERVADSTINLALGKAADGAMTGYPELGIEGQGVAKITNGLLDTEYAVIGKSGWGYTGEIYGIIDLGAYYDASSIDDILIQYSNKQADTGVITHAYKVQYSTDNEYYYDAVPLKTVTAYENDIPRTIDDVSNVTGAVRYVKVYWPVSPGYGAQLSEIAVLADNARIVEEQTVTAPTFTVVVPEKTYNTISVTVGGSEETATYAVLVDGVAALEGVTAGTYEITGVKSGEHTITAVAINNGFSKAAEGKAVTVEDGFTLNVTGNATVAVFAENKDGLHNHVVGHEGVAGSASDGNYKDAIDQNTGTRWGTGSSDPQYLTIDLGAVRKIKEVDIHWETASAKDYTIDVSNDGNTWETVAVITDGKDQGNRLDTITLTDEAQARYVRMNGTARATNYGYSIWEMAIYGSDDESATTTEETTTLGGITPTTEPTDAEWTLFSASDTYYRYVPSGNEGAFKIADNQFIQQAEGLYFGLNFVPSNIKANGVAVTNIMPGNGAEMRLAYDNFSQNGAYQVTFTANNNEYTVWIKKETPKDYKPTGVLATSDATAKTATVKWTPSADAIAAGCTYTVQIANLEPVAVVGAEATVDITSLTFGSYDVTVNAVDASGNVLGSTKIQFEYKDPDKVYSNLSTQYQWEGRRRERLSWDNVDNATGYAIYTDGKLFETTTDLNMDVYAYAFANAENTNGQKTTVGSHTTKVVALFNGEEAPAYDQINEKHVIGENSFDLYVNYIFGRYTDIWNEHIEKSLWAFTICESGDAPDTDKGKVVKGANAKVIYNDDGSASITINDVGKHSSFKSMTEPGDQAWTIKTASYDAPVTKDQLVNLSYDITGPASLVGQEIRIKVCPEETDENGGYLEAEYLNKYYTFVDDGNGGAVIHFTETFTSTNDTYDMFFGLGLLQNPDDENKTPIELTIEEAEAKDIYGVHSVTASPVNPRDEDAVNEAGNHTTHGIMVQWETDVPYRLRKDYKYEVFIDGVKTTEGFLNGEKVDPNDAKTGAVWYDYECGPEPGKKHTVKVVSYYNGTETAQKETTVYVRNRSYPDLVISNILVKDNDTKEYYTGDKVPVDVTIKNISTIDAVAADKGALSVHLYLRKPDGTLTAQKAFFTIDDEDTDGNHILKAGAEVTKTMYYTVDPADAGANWRYTFVARADADGKVDEGQYEDNNEFARTFIFPNAPDKVTLVNDGTNITASWPGSEVAHHYLINYVSNGEAKSIETKSNNTSYVLKDVLDNESTVEVYSIRSNGAKVIRAIGTALADLTITDIGAVGVATVNKAVDFKGTIKNVGVARATSANNEKIIALTVSGSDGEKDWSGYNSVPDGLAPNETVDITLSGTSFIPKQEGKLTLTGNVNDTGRIPEVDRKAGPIDTEDNNNRKAFDVDVVPTGSLKLVNVDGKVYADFTLDTEQTVQMYAVTYTSNGVEKTDYVTPEEVLDGNRIALNAPLDNLSTVSIAARYTAEDAYFTFATDTAKVDLTVSKVEIVNEKGEVLTENFKVDTFEEFYARTYITNIGTAQVKSYHSDSWEEEYANAIFVTARDADGKVLQGNQQDAIEQYNEGLLVGATASIDVGTIQLSKQGKQTISVKVDDPGWDVEGYITESNEENNTMSVELDVNLVQQPMDWTPLYTQGDKTKIHDFKVANGTIARNIEFKVLDTSYTDIDYKDLVTQYCGYTDAHMSIQFEGNHQLYHEYTEDGTKWTSSNLWFQQVPKSYLVDENGNDTGNVQVEDNEYLSRIPSQAVDIHGYDGKEFPATSETPLGYVGNGFNFYVNSFAPGKYYMMTIVDYDPDTIDEAGNMKMRNYVTLAFRVTTELEGWSRIGASDATDIDKLAAFYHDSNHQVNAKFYYDCSNLGLACISAYNGTHLTLTTDTSKKLNDDVKKTKIEIAYGVYDETTRKVIEPANWSDVCVNPGIYGKEGTNNLQIDIASLMRQLPVHSEKGGATDREYYYLKVYYDTENEPDSFIPVPMMIVAEIPEIIPVQGLEVTNRGSLMTVNWTASNTQIADGYLYDIFIDGNLARENVPAGSYNFAGTGEIGETHTVVVRAKWCDQKADATLEYVMKEPETEPAETIPGGSHNYPLDGEPHKWVKINGQCVLPVKDGSKYDGSTVNAEIWYYTDDDLNSVVGYNDHFISINGSDQYFTGDSSRIYVQDENVDIFESKSIYDKYYEGQIQIKSAEMFKTPETWENGMTYYYTVRVAGNNGNTYKDFFFKVIPTEESSSINTTGKWRLISGEHELPVKRNDTELQGTVKFLDCPNTIEGGYTGTNTYDIVGYNGYYMSIIGDTQYYTGEDTKISVSDPQNTVKYAEDAGNLKFTEKRIYDKAYPGQIIIKCADTFSVEYAKTYYLLKVESGTNITYIPIEIQVNTGNVEVLGFQMNTNQNAGAVSEHSPSFRVVSKTSKVMTVDNELRDVKKMGTIYAAADEMAEMDDETIRQNMTIDGVAENDFIQNYETTQKGTLQGYTTTESDNRYNTYFALTFKFNNYMYRTLEQNYAVRAYAVLEDGTIVYGKKIFTTNMYEIAQNLYENQKMGTKAAHDFLYNNILNLVDMNNHRSQIANAMFKALNIKTASDSRYKIINTMTKDIYDYAICQNGYTYKDREQFRCAEVEDELLELLNGISGNEKTYTSVYDWIYTEVPKYDKKDGTKYQGCYRTVEYGWDNTIDKDFYTDHKGLDFSLDPIGPIGPGVLQ